MDECKEEVKRNLQKLYTEVLTCLRRADHIINSLNEAIEESWKKEKVVENPKKKNINGIMTPLWWDERIEH